MRRAYSAWEPFGNDRSQGCADSALGWYETGRVASYRASEICGALNLGLRSSDSLQPRLSHYGLSALGGAFGRLPHEGGGGVSASVASWYRGAEAQRLSGLTDVWSMRSQPRTPKVFASRLRTPMDREQGPSRAGAFGAGL